MHTDTRIRPLDDAELQAVAGGNAWSDVGYAIGYGLSEALHALASIPIDPQILLLI